MKPELNNSAPTPENTIESLDNMNSISNDTIIVAKSSYMMNSGSLVIVTPSIIVFNKFAWMSCGYIAPTGDATTVDPANVAPTIAMLPAGT
jgi:hypothetical protein